MSSVQRSLSEYLQCELYHSLGAYGVAERRLEALASELEGPGVENGAVRLRELVGLSRAHNQTLRQNRHASLPALRSASGNGAESGGPRWPARDPLPEKLPLTEKERFSISTTGDKRALLRLRRDPWQADSNWTMVPKFYSEAIEALNKYNLEPEDTDDHYEQFRQLLARSLITPRDGGKWRDRDGLERLSLRLDRYKNRREEAHLALSPDAPRHSGIGDRVRDFGRTLQTLGDATPSEPLGLDEEYKLDHKLLERIATEYLSKGNDSLGMFVVRTQAEAHLSMHGVEAWKSMCLGEHAESLGEDERGWLDEELKQSIVLSTFAYCVSRTAPWLFAKDEAEWKAVYSDVGEAWENIVPTRCMWIANQISLLALHRRAYARSLQDESEQSYNDYHKLQQLIRDTERRVWEAPIHAEGALEFLAGLNAEAHHHIGELYRAEHAHKPALEHFEAASHRLNQLRDEETVPEVLTDSRWNVQLHISHGKACYEMGRHKEALYWYLHGWCAFLELFATTSQTETNTEAIEEAIEWLDSVKFEPELRKSEISERLRPVVDQLDRITAVGPLGALAAEILLRLGHLLFVLNIGFDDVEASAPESGSDENGNAKERVRRTLAFACLAKAAECDPHSTLAGADLLKATFRLESEINSKKSLADHLPDLKRPDVKPIGQHWPHGGDDYEQLTRAAEYVLLNAHAHKEDGEIADDARIARDLLLNLFMSTDSINVRKAQIHRFLMKDRNKAPIPGNPAPAIEFVCMRRYSSPFPLLPRPSAFRALGGGYFLRLHGTGDRTEDGEGPYGVVIDPGVDFVENLYRTGYSLGDIDMIVLTHDHVDHLGALDPILSLLHVRSELLSQQAKYGKTEAAKQEKAQSKEVKVLTSQSVAWRYKKVERLQESSEIDFQCFEDSGFKGENGVLDMDHAFFSKFPEPFEIVAISSAAGHRGEEAGHCDLSLRPSHGLCFRAEGGRGPSLAITSDTPSPPASDPELHAEWLRAWGPALEADVLVAHLSSVPLTELRRMDQTDREPMARPPTEPPDPVAKSLQEDEKALLGFRDTLQDANTHLRGQIEYAQWLRSHVPEGVDPDRVMAPLVGRVPGRWLPPTDHNYLTGLLAWAGSYLAAPDGEAAPRSGSPHDEDRPEGKRRGGLFVVGELSEELASMRGKIASRLNELLFEAPDKRAEVEANQAEDTNRSPCALTADIGLHVCIIPAAEDSKRRESRIKVLCTTCNLDTDRAPGERYHFAHGIHEVCVKGENEGIFYNCLEHDPKSQDDPMFLEQLERFDIFGR